MSSSPTITPTPTDKALRRALGSNLMDATLRMFLYIGAVAVIGGGLFWLLA